MAKKHPILFSTEMVEAILSGRKTQTRRVVKPCNKDQIVDWDSAEVAEHRFFNDCGINFEYLRVNYKPSIIYKKEYQGVIFPKWVAGDELWVRETWAHGCMGGYIYKAGHENARDLSELKQWKPSIHMPKSACRLHLPVTGVRVERLQDINQEDAKAEGFKGKHCPLEDYENLKHYFVPYWEDLNYKRGYGWDSNPWVWVVEFEKKG